MKIIAVVVTYNRLQLLKKAVNSLQEQTRKPDEIIVVNNGSTDQTEAWLLAQPVFTHTQENKGGAGGFAAGINLAYARGADWIWLMDDDTIPTPTALFELENVIVQHKSEEAQIGFLSSSVLWTDGNEHKMNRTYQLKDKKKLEKLTIANKVNLPLIQWGTFVSMLVSAKAVEKVGLPYKEFFIWCDDAEFAKRVIDAGMAGFAVKQSIVYHETPTNHFSSVLDDPESAKWKYKYGLRNELFTKRLHQGELQFWITWTHRMFIMPFRIYLKRKDHRWSFTKLLWKTSLEALSFQPKIQMPDPRSKVTNADAMKEVAGLSERERKVQVNTISK